MEKKILKSQSDILFHFLNTHMPVVGEGVTEQRKIDAP